MTRSWTQALNSLRSERPHGRLKEARGSDHEQGEEETTKLDFKGKNSYQDHELPHASSRDGINSSRDNGPENNDDQNQETSRSDSKIDTNDPGLHSNKFEAETEVKPLSINQLESPFEPTTSSATVELKNQVSETAGKSSVPLHPAKSDSMTSAKEVGCLQTIVGGPYRKSIQSLGIAINHYIFYL
jgi:hypothetical protein